MSGSQRLGLIILLAVFGAYLAREAFLSVHEIIRVNDFEVFHHVGEVARTRQPLIYDVVSPVKQRGPFLYPPSAAVLFVPLGLLPHDVAGVIFAVAKIACLILLYWGSVRFSGTPPRDWLGMLIAMVAPLVIAHRAIDSDVGNGQINIFVAAAAAGGVWLMMLNRRWWWLGGLTLAWAIAIKLTPVLLLVVPLLNRKWNQFSAAVGMTCLMVVILPAIWFGGDNYRHILQRHSEITGRFALDWPALGRQVTLMEMVQFTGVQVRGDLKRQGAFEDADRSTTITGQSGANLLNPELRPRATRIWIAVGVVVGALFLLCRMRLFRHHALDWTWDLAMLCAMIVLLSPRAHKAHLAILIVPAGWIAARLLRRIDATGWHSHRKSNLAALASLVVLCAMFIISENLAIPLPGVFEEPYRCVGFLGMLLMIGMIVWLKADENRPGESTSAPPLAR